MPRAGRFFAIALDVSLVSEHYSTLSNVIRITRKGHEMDENTRWQKLAAEFLGTAFLVFVGVGSVPALLLVNEANGSTFSGSDLGIISLSFATVVIVTVYVFGYISGNHINPAVTLGLAATGKFPWSEVPSYVVAQVLGAVAGAFAIVGVLGQKASDVGLGVASYADTIPWYQAFFAEFIGTFLLVFAVFGVIYRKAAPGWAGPGHRHDGVRGHHPGRPHHRRLDQPRPHHRPDARAAGHGRGRHLVPVAGLRDRRAAPRVSQPRCCSGSWPTRRRTQPVPAATAAPSEV